MNHSGALPYIGTNNYEGAEMGGEYAVSNLGISGKKSRTVSSADFPSADASRRLTAA